MSRKRKEHPVRVSLNFSIPVVPPGARIKAQEMVDAKFDFQKADGVVSLSPSDITDHDILAEARRISALADEHRTVEIGNMLASVLPLVRDAQGLAATLLRMAEALDDTAVQMETARQLSPALKKTGLEPL